MSEMKTIKTKGMPIDSSMSIGELILAVQHDPFYSQIWSLKYWSSSYQKDREKNDKNSMFYSEKEFRDAFNAVVHGRYCTFIQNKDDKRTTKTMESFERFLKKYYQDQYDKNVMWHEAIWKNVVEFRLPKSLAELVQEAYDRGYISKGQAKEFDVGLYQHSGLLRHPSYKGHWYEDVFYEDSQRKVGLLPERIFHFHPEYESRLAKLYPQGVLESQYREIVHRRTQRQDRVMRKYSEKANVKGVEYV
jgi:hypothetical protein